jgi:hypothetical protein
MRKKVGICVLFLIFGILIPSVGRAQSLTTSEIGLSIGTMTTKDKIFRLNIPGRGVNGSSGVYLSYFYKPEIMLTPRFELGVTHFDRATNTQIGIDGQVAYLFRPYETSSPYLGCGFTLLMQSYENTSTVNSGMGISAGFRNVLIDAIGLRFELRYQRWMTEKNSELIFSVGIGAIFRSN